MTENLKQICKAFKEKMMVENLKPICKAFVEWVELVWEMEDTKALSNKTIGNKKQKLENIVKELEYECGLAQLKYNNLLGEKND